jgi:predicted nucleotidyltransferase
MTRSKEKEPRILGRRLEAAADVARRLPEIDVLYLFGSFAAGNAHRLSDIDLGVLLGAHVASEKYFDLKRKYITEFADALMTDGVDVVVLNEAPAHLAFEVIAPRNVLFERNPVRRVEFEVRAVNAFLDFRPILEARRGYVKQQLAQGEFFG